ncbi:MAG: hypothetical protein ABOK23_03140 [Candidatus Methanoperedens sp.]|nr:hypothetical protein [Candidatus Methanoperedens sp.]MCZ7395687.1 hypothetical protein [Candidatus Methanoperedens sp.]
MFLAHFLVERLKLPEQPRVIEEVLEIIDAAELEDVNTGTLFSYIERWYPLS